MNQQVIKHLVIVLHYPVKGSVLLWPGYYEGNEQEIEKHLKEVEGPLPEGTGFYSFLKNNPHKIFVKKKTSNK